MHALLTGDAKETEIEQLLKARAAELGLPLYVLSSNEEKSPILQGNQHLCCCRREEVVRRFEKDNLALFATKAYLPGSVYVSGAGL